MIGFFNKVFQQAFGWEDSTMKFQPIGGGCINNAYKLSTSRGDYFIKCNRDQPQMFEVEYRGLQLLSQSGCLGVPTPHRYGVQEGMGYLLMEYVEPGRMDGGFWEQLGRGLACLHKVTSSHFGLDHDNYIGSLPQKNDYHDGWVDFFVNCRLLPQVELARNSGLITAGLVGQFEALYTKLPDLMPEEPPALLHGDLWSGNIHSDVQSKPYVIDPAAYYGHREAELAFTTLFGGFGDAFYKNYRDEFPLAPGFDERTGLFNLYPLLVHVNLFGASYLTGIVNTLKRFAS